MDVRKEIQKVWQSIGKQVRRIVRSFAKGSSDDALRIRCMVVINLIQGESPTLIARILNCSRSHVYRVARHWVEEGLAALLDRWEDNGQEKTTEDYQATFCLSGKESNSSVRRIAIPAPRRPPSIIVMRQSFSMISAG